MAHHRVLEIGPNSYPSTYRRAVNVEGINWETLNIYKDDRLTYVAESEYSFGIADNTFDIVLSGQVIEHVRKPWVWIRELTRVCKRGGYVITIGPISWPYHEAPVDCWRIYPEGMTSLYDEAGLWVALCKMESLEKKYSRRIWYEKGALSQKDYSYTKNLIKKIIGWPQAIAIDVITIGVKK